MLGEFITGGLVLVLGYAYPAFECFKTLEKNKVEMAELRFWCQYWIIVALLTVFERVGDVFVSWLPLYGEMKLALFIYLWYPKTKGTVYIYERILRPCVAAHEPELDRNFQELRARAWDLALYYWHNCTELGQTAFFQVIQFLATGKIPKPNAQMDENNCPAAAAPPPPPAGPPAFHLMADNRNQPSDRRRPPLPHIVNRSMDNQAPKSDVVQVHPHSQTGFVHTHEEFDPADYHTGFGSPDESEYGADHSRHAARPRFTRRSKGFN